MRVSQEEKDRSHARIVESAARLVRERGIEGTSVADVMGDAGMTHGGFYRHFDTKEALLAAALESAFEQILSLLETQPGDDKAQASVPEYRAHYLSQTHVDTPGMGCPLASLGADVARGSEALKSVFGAGVARTIATLATDKSGSKAERRAVAARELALMVGAVTLARAADPATARTVLEACRSSLGIALGAQPSAEMVRKHAHLVADHVTRRTGRPAEHEVSDTNPAPGAKSKKKSRRGKSL